MNSAQEHLLLCFSKIFEPSGLVFFSPPVQEAEGAAYGACKFVLNNRSICFRVAKITPTKNGHFVTLWKRPKSGRIKPFHESDNIDLFMISARDGKHFGLFIFSKVLLISKGIVSSGNNNGKLAIRLYPPWVQPESKQAAKSQAWQIACFVEGLNVDGGLVRALCKI